MHAGNPAALFCGFALQAAQVRSSQRPIALHDPVQLALYLLFCLPHSHE